MGRERAPKPGDNWETFLQQHNERVIPDDAPDPPSSRADRRAARKRTRCALCGEDLAGAGRPMTRKRWRCDVQAPCEARRQARTASGL